MTIAADNHVGAACHGTFQNAIIVRVVGYDVQNNVRLNHQSRFLQPGAHACGILFAHHELFTQLLVQFVE
jgi:hypothetical protein